MAKNKFNMTPVMKVVVAILQIFLIMALPIDTDSLLRGEEPLDLGHAVCTYTETVTGTDPETGEEVQTQETRTASGPEIAAHCSECAGQTGNFNLADWTTGVESCGYSPDAMPDNILGRWILADPTGARAELLSSGRLGEFLVEEPGFIVRVSVASLGPAVESLLLSNPEYVEDNVGRFLKVFEERPESIELLSGEFPLLMEAFFAEFGVLAASACSGISTFNADTGDVQPEGRGPAFNIYETREVSSEGNEPFSFGSGCSLIGTPGGIFEGLTIVGGSLFRGSDGIWEFSGSEVTYVGEQWEAGTTMRFLNSFLDYNGIKIEGADFTVVAQDTMTYGSSAQVSNLFITAGTANRELATTNAYAVEDFVTITVGGKSFQFIGSGNLVTEGVYTGSISLGPYSAVDYQGHRIVNRKWKASAAGGYLYSVTGVGGGQVTEIFGNNMGYIIDSGNGLEIKTAQNGARGDQSWSVFAPRPLDFLSYDSTGQSSGGEDWWTLDSEGVHVRLAGRHTGAEGDLARLSTVITYTDRAETAAGKAFGGETYTLTMQNGIVTVSCEGGRNCDAASNQMYGQLALGWDPYERHYDGGFMAKLTKWVDKIMDVALTISTGGLYLLADEDLRTDIKTAVNLVGTVVAVVAACFFSAGTLCAPAVGAAGGAWGSFAQGGEGAQLAVSAGVGAAAAYVGVGVGEFLGSAVSTGLQGTALAGTTTATVISGAATGVGTAAGSAAVNTGVAVLSGSSWSEAISANFQAETFAVAALTGGLTGGLEGTTLSNAQQWAAQQSVKAAVSAINGEDLESILIDVAVNAAFTGALGGFSDAGLNNYGDITGTNVVDTLSGFTSNVIQGEDIEAALVDATVTFAGNYLADRALGATDLSGLDVQQQQLAQTAIRGLVEGAVNVAVYSSLGPESDLILNPAYRPRECPANQECDDRDFTRLLIGNEVANVFNGMQQTLTDESIRGVVREQIANDLGLRATQLREAEDSGDQNAIDEARENYNRAVVLAGNAEVFLNEAERDQYQNLEVRDANNQELSPEERQQLEELRDRQLGYKEDYLNVELTESELEVQEAQERLSVAQASGDSEEIRVAEFNLQAAQARQASITSEIIGVFGVRNNLAIRDLEERLEDAQQSGDAQEIENIRSELESFNNLQEAFQFNQLALTTVVNEHQTAELEAELERVREQNEGLLGFLPGTDRQVSDQEARLAAQLNRNRVDQNNLNLLALQRSIAAGVATQEQFQDFAEVNQEIISQFNTNAQLARIEKEEAETALLNAEEEDRAGLLDRIDELTIAQAESELDAQNSLLNQINLEIQTLRGDEQIGGLLSEEQYNALSQDQKNRYDELLDNRDILENDIQLRNDIIDTTTVQRLERSYQELIDEANDISSPSWWNPFSWNNQQEREELLNQANTDKNLVQTIKDRRQDLFGTASDSLGVETGYSLEFRDGRNFLIDDNGNPLTYEGKEIYLDDDGVTLRQRDDRLFGLDDNLGEVEKGGILRFTRSIDQEINNVLPTGIEFASDYVVDFELYNFEGRDYEAVYVEVEGELEFAGYADVETGELFEEFGGSAVGFLEGGTLFKESEIISIADEINLESEIATAQDSRQLVSQEAINQIAQTDPTRARELQEYNEDLIIGSQVAQELSNFERGAIPDEVFERIAQVVGDEEAFTYALIDLEIAAGGRIDDQFIQDLRDFGRLEIADSYRSYNTQYDFADIQQQIFRGTASESERASFLNSVPENEREYYSNFIEVSLLQRNQERITPELLNYFSNENVDILVDLEVYNEKIDVFETATNLANSGERYEITEFERALLSTEEIKLIEEQNEFVDLSNRISESIENNEYVVLDDAERQKFNPEYVELIDQHNTQILTVSSRTVDFLSDTVNLEPVIRSVIESGSKQWSELSDVERRDFELQGVNENNYGQILNQLSFQGTITEVEPVQFEDEDQRRISELNIERYGQELERDNLQSSISELENQIREKQEQKDNLFFLNFGERGILDDEIEDLERQLSSAQRDLSLTENRLEFLNANLESLNPSEESFEDAVITIDPTFLGEGEVTQFEFEFEETPSGIISDKSIIVGADADAPNLRFQAQQQITTGVEPDLSFDPDEAVLVDGERKIIRRYVEAGVVQLGDGTLANVDQLEHILDENGFKTEATDQEKAEAYRFEVVNGQLFENLRTGEFGFIVDPDVERRNAQNEIGLALGSLDQESYEAIVQIENANLQNFLDQRENLRAEIGEAGFFQVDIREDRFSDLNDAANSLNSALLVGEARRSLENAERIEQELRFLIDKNTLDPLSDVTDSLNGVDIFISEAGQEQDYLTNIFSDLHTIRTIRIQKEVAQEVSPGISQEQFNAIVLERVAQESVADREAVLGRVDNLIPEEGNIFNQVWTTVKGFGELLTPGSQEGEKLAGTVGFLSQMGNQAYGDLENSRLASQALGDRTAELASLLEQQELYAGDSTRLFDGAIDKQERVGFGSDFDGSAFNQGLGTTFYLLGQSFTDNADNFYSDQARIDREGTAFTRLTNRYDEDVVTMLEMSDDQLRQIASNKWPGDIEKAEAEFGFLQDDVNALRNSAAYQAVQTRADFDVTQQVNTKFVQPEGGLATFINTVDPFTSGVGVGTSYAVFGTIGRVAAVGGKGINTAKLSLAASSKPLLQSVARGIDISQRTFNVITAPARATFGLTGRIGDSLKTGVTTRLKSTLGTGTVRDKVIDFVGSNVEYWGAEILIEEGLISGVGGNLLGEVGRAGGSAVATDVFGNLPDVAELLAGGRHVNINQFANLGVSTPKDRLIDTGTSVIRDIPVENREQLDEFVRNTPSLQAAPTEQIVDSSGEVIAERFSLPGGQEIQISLPSTEVDSQVIRFFESINPDGDEIRMVTVPDISTLNLDTASRTISGQDISTFFGGDYSTYTGTDVVIEGQRAIQFTDRTNQNRPLVIVQNDNPVANRLQVVDSVSYTTDNAVINGVVFSENSFNSENIDSTIDTLRRTDGYIQGSLDSSRISDGVITFETTSPTGRELVIVTSEGRPITPGQTISTDVGPLQINQIVNDAQIQNFRFDTVAVNRINNILTAQVPSAKVQKGDILITSSGDSSTAQEIKVSNANIDTIQQVLSSNGFENINTEGNALRGHRVTAFDTVNQEWVVVNTGGNLFEGQNININGNNVEVLTVEEAIVRNEEILETSSGDLISKVEVSGDIDAWKDHLAQQPGVVIDETNSNARQVSYVQNGVRNIVVQTSASPRIEGETLQTSDQKLSQAIGTLSTGQGTVLDEVVDARPFLTTRSTRVDNIASEIIALSKVRPQDAIDFMQGLDLINYNSELNRYDFNVDLGSAYLTDFVADFNREVSAEVSGQTTETPAIDTEVVADTAPSLVPAIVEQPLAPTVELHRGLNSITPDQALTLLTDGEQAVGTRPEGRVARFAGLVRQQTGVLQDYYKSFAEQKQGATRYALESAFKEPSSNYGSLILNHFRSVFRTSPSDVTTVEMTRSEAIEVMQRIKDNPELGLDDVNLVYTADVPQDQADTIRLPGANIITATGNEYSVTGKVEAQSIKSVDLVVRVSDLGKLDSMLSEIRGTPQQLSAPEPTFVQRTAAAVTGYGRGIRDSVLSIISPIGGLLKLQSDIAVTDSLTEATQIQASPEFDTTSALQSVTELILSKESEIEAAPDFAATENLRSQLSNLRTIESLIVNGNTQQAQVAIQALGIALQIDAGTTTLADGTVQIDDATANAVSEFSDLEKLLVAQEIEKKTTEIDRCKLGTIDCFGSNENSIETALDDVVGDSLEDRIGRIQLDFQRAQALNRDKLDSKNQELRAVFEAESQQFDSLARNPSVTSMPVEQREEFFREAAVAFAVNGLVPDVNVDTPIFLGSILGEGQGGVVYEQEFQGTPIAIKVFKSYDFATVEPQGISESNDLTRQTPNSLKNRWVREVENALILQRLNLGPKVLGVVDVGGNPALITERVPGKPFDKLNAQELELITQSSKDQMFNIIESLEREGYVDFDNYQSILITEPALINGQQRNPGDVVMIDADRIESVETVTNEGLEGIAESSKLEALAQLEDVDSQGDAVRARIQNLEVIGNEVYITKEVGIETNVFQRTVENGKFVWTLGRFEGDKYQAMRFVSESLFEDLNAQIGDVDMAVTVADVANKVIRNFPVTEQETETAREKTEELELEFTPINPAESSRSLFSDFDSQSTVKMSIVETVGNQFGLNTQDMRKLRYMFGIEKGLEANQKQAQHIAYERLEGSERLKFAIDALERISEGGRVDRVQPILGSFVGGDTASNALVSINTQLQFAAILGAENTFEDSLYDQIEGVQEKESVIAEIANGLEFSEIQFDSSQVEAKVDPAPTTVGDVVAPTVLIETRQPEITEIDGEKTLIFGEFSLAGYGAYGAVFRFTDDDGIDKVVKTAGLPKVVLDRVAAPESHVPLNDELAITQLNLEVIINNELDEGLSIVQIEEVVDVVIGGETGVGYVMEEVKGETIFDLFNNRENVAIEADVQDKLAQTLAELREDNVVAYDVGGRNVMLQEVGTAQIGDRTVPLYGDPIIIDIGSVLPIRTLADPTALLTDWVVEQNSVNKITETFRDLSQIPHVGDEALSQDQLTQRVERFSDDMTEQDYFNFPESSRAGFISPRFAALIAGVSLAAMTFIAPFVGNNQIIENQQQTVIEQTVESRDSVYETALPQAPVQQDINYEVSQGDTLFSISRAYGVTIEQIRQANNIEGDRINVGQVLTISFETVGGVVQQTFDYDAFAVNLEIREGRRNRMYLDGSGRPTIGVGHLLDNSADDRQLFSTLFGSKYNYDQILSGQQVMSEADVNTLRNADIDIELEKARTIFTNFDSYPYYLQEALLDGVYRGEHNSRFRTTSLINEERFADASIEYVNRADYRFEKASLDYEAAIARYGQNDARTRAAFNDWISETRRYLGEGAQNHINRVADSRRKGLNPGIVSRMESNQENIAYREIEIAIEESNIDLTDSQVEQLRDKFAGTSFTKSDVIEEARSITEPRIAQNTRGYFRNLGQSLMAAVAPIAVAGALFFGGGTAQAQEITPEQAQAQIEQVYLQTDANGDIILDAEGNPTIRNIIPEENSVDLAATPELLSAFGDNTIDYANSRIVVVENSDYRNNELDVDLKGTTDNFLETVEHYGGSDIVKIVDKNKDDLLEELEAALKVDKPVIMFFAGHGRNVGEYVYSAREAMTGFGDQWRVNRGGISRGEITERELADVILRANPDNQKTVMLASCYSGTCGISVDGLHRVEDTLIIASAPDYLPSIILGISSVEGLEITEPISYFRAEAHNLIKPDPTNPLLNFDPALPETMDTRVREAAAIILARDYGKRVNDLNTLAEKANFDINVPYILPIKGGIRLTPTSKDVLQELSRTEKAELLLGKEITPEQAQAIEDAHIIGDGVLGEKNEDGTYEKYEPTSENDQVRAYTTEELLQKARILADAGFNTQERRIIIEYGLAGTEMFNPFLEDIDSKDTQRIAQELFNSEFTRGETVTVLEAYKQYLNGDFDASLITLSKVLPNKMLELESANFVWPSRESEALNVQTSESKARFVFEIGTDKGGGIGAFLLSDTVDLLKITDLSNVDQIIDDYNSIGSEFTDAIVSGFESKFSKDKVRENSEKFRQRMVEQAVDYNVKDLKQLQDVESRRVVLEMMKGLSDEKTELIYSLGTQESPRTLSKAQEILNILIFDFAIADKNGNKGSLENYLQTYYSDLGLDINIRGIEMKEMSESISPLALRAIAEHTFGKRIPYQQVSEALLRGDSIEDIVTIGLDSSLETENGQELLSIVKEMQEMLSSQVPHLIIERGDKLKSVPIMAALIESSEVNLRGQAIRFLNGEQMFIVNMDGDVPPGIRIFDSLSTVVHETDHVVGDSVKIIDTGNKRGLYLSEGRAELASLRFQEAQISKAIEEGWDISVLLNMRRASQISSKSSEYTSGLQILEVLSEERSFESLYSEDLPMSDATFDAISRALDVRNAEASEDHYYLNNYHGFQIARMVNYYISINRPDIAADIIDEHSSTNVDRSKDLKSEVERILNDIFAEKVDFIKAREIQSIKGAAEAVLGRSINDKELAAIVYAHSIGEGVLGTRNLDGTYNKYVPTGPEDTFRPYTFSELRKKRQALYEAGFTKTQIRDLIEFGVAGNEAVSWREFGRSWENTPITDRGLPAQQLVLMLSASNPEYLSSLLIQSSDPEDRATLEELIQISLVEAANLQINEGQFISAIESNRRTIEEIIRNPGIIGEDQLDFDAEPQLWTPQPRGDEEIRQVARSGFESTYNKPFKEVLFSNGLFVDSTGKPITVEGAIWVITEDWEFVIAQRDEKIPHPNLALGKSVYGAGELDIVLGKIVYADPQTGHYYPRGESEEIIREFDEKVMNAFIATAISQGIPLKDAEISTEVVRSQP